MLVALLSKNNLTTECNRTLYDKELHAIIRYPEHWNVELRSFQRIKTGVGQDTALFSKGKEYS
jgi:hypothetical protein